MQRELSTQAPRSQCHVCVPQSLEFGTNSIEFIDVNTGCCRHGSQGGHPPYLDLEVLHPIRLFCIGSGRLINKV